MLAGGPGAASSLAIILETDMSSMQPPGPEPRDSWCMQARETATRAHKQREAQSAYGVWGGGLW